MKISKNFPGKAICLLTMLLTLVLWQVNEAEAAGDSTAEKRPKIIALLPVENMSLLEGCDGDRYVSEQLGRLIHVPLNGITNSVAYIDSRESRGKLEDLVESGKYVTKKNRPDYAAIMPVLADELGADLVIFLRVRRAHQYIYHDWWGRTCIDAGVELELFGFDRGQVPALAAAGESTKKKKVLPPGVIKDSVRRDIHEEYAGQGLYELTVEAFDWLMAGNEMRERVFPTRK